MSAPRPAGGPGGEGGAQALKAVLVIVVVVLIGWAVLHRSGKTVATTSASTAPPTTHAVTSPSTSVATPTTALAPTTTTTLVPVSSVKLTVLNGTGITGVAGKWTTKLKASPGYDTTAPDNATSNVSASMIYVITPGYLPEAYALATTVGLPSTSVNTTVPAPASAPIPTVDRQIANLILVIGPDLAAKV